MTMYTFQSVTIDYSALMAGTKNHDAACWVVVVAVGIEATVTNQSQGSCARYHRAKFESKNKQTAVN